MPEVLWRSDLDFVELGSCGNARHRVTGSSSGVSRHLGVLLPRLLFGCYSNRVVLNLLLEMSAAWAVFCSRQAVTIADLGSAGFPKGGIGLGDYVRIA